MNDIVDNERKQFLLNDWKKTERKQFLLNDWKKPNEMGLAQTINERNTI